MANKIFRPAMGALEVNVVDLFLDFTIGASGAVASTNGLGILSVVKESTAGQYTVTLDQTYNAMLFAGTELLDTADSDPSSVGCLIRVKSRSVTTTVPTVVLQCFASDDGAAANPASGAKIYLLLKLRNSTVTSR